MIEPVIIDNKIVGRRDPISNGIVFNTPVPQEVLNREKRLKDEESQKNTIRGLIRRMAKLEHRIMELEKIVAKGK